MRVSISLTRLVLKGLMENIGISSVSNEVRQLIGDPEDIGRGMGKVKIEKYFGGVYLNRGFLSMGKVHQLNIDFPENTERDEKGFLDWLDKEGIAYQNYGDDKQSFSWKFGSGAVVTFVDGVMESIQVR